MSNQPITVKVPIAFTLNVPDGATVSPTTVDEGGTITVTQGTPPPPVITGVTVSGPATVLQGATAQFIAQVSGSGNYDKTVTWSASDGSITQAGLFTAPQKVENVVVTATANGDNSKKGTANVSIANQGNTVTIPPSGGNDTSALQAALNKLTSGQILQMLLGTWNIGPIQVPKNTSLLITPAALLNDIKGYGFTDCMFTTDDGVIITGTGAFLQMLNSFAASQADGSEYRHAFRITGKAPTVSGISVSQAGGDGFYGVNLTGGILQNVAAKMCFRNGCSLTDNVNGFLVATSIFGKQAGGDKVIQAGLDVEANISGASQPCVVTLTGLQLLDNVGFPISNGLRLSLNNLAVNNPAVKVLVNNCTARGNTSDFHTVWPGTSKPSGWIVAGSGNVDSKGPTSYPN